MNFRIGFKASLSITVNRNCSTACAISFSILKAFRLQQFLFRYFLILKSWLPQANCSETSSACITFGCSSDPHKDSFRHRANYGQNVLILWNQALFWFSKISFLSKVVLVFLYNCFPSIHRQFQSCKQGFLLSLNNLE
jgi:hypothetical protein